MHEATKQYANKPVRLLGMQENKFIFGRKRWKFILFINTVKKARAHTSLSHQLS